MITPKSARKSRNRRITEYAVRQLAQIVKDLEGIAEEGETPVVTVRRLISLLPAKARKAAKPNAQKEAE